MLLDIVAEGKTHNTVVINLGQLRQVSLLNKHYSYLIEKQSRLRYTALKLILSHSDYMELFALTFPDELGVTHNDLTL